MIIDEKALEAVKAVWPYRDGPEEIDAKARAVIEAYEAARGKSEIFVEHRGSVIQARYCEYSESNPWEDALGRKIRPQPTIFRTIDPSPGANVSK